MLHRISVVVLAFLLFSCASALKKQCEATNWFEHGKSVALSGRRLNSDDFVQRCQKEEVEVNEAQVDLGFKAGMGVYCTAEGAKETGRKGDVFNAELCDQGVVRALRKSWSKGVVEYCSPANAYRVGALGQEYKNVCPKKLEKKFLKRFNKGKYVYYTNMIDAKEDEIRQQRQRQRELRRDRSRVQGQLNAVMAAHKIAQLRRRGPDPVRDEEYRVERDSLDSQIRSYNRQISSIDAKIDKIRSEIMDLKVKRGSVKE